MDQHKIKDKKLRWAMRAAVAVFATLLIICVYSLLSVKHKEDLTKLNAEVKQAVQEEYDHNTSISGIVVEKVELEPASAGNTYRGLVVLSNPSAKRTSEHEIQVNLIDGKISYNIMRMN